MVESPKRSPIGLSHVKNSKVQKPPAIKKPPSKNKDGSDHKSPTSIFGPHAVTRYLCIPQTGNITGVELTVFLPELLRTPGVLFRFFQNGADAQTLARISTWFRATVKGHHTPATAANAMRHITQSTMRRHFEDEHWTETRHKAGWYVKAGQVWDHDNLTFAGVKTYCEVNAKDGRHKRLPIPNVRFTSLAADVVVFPSGNDALDLTRCVKAAVANEELPLMFPRDYGYLTRLLGGPAIVQPAHRDRELFSRWKQVNWVETPSERQIKTACDFAHYRFTAAQNRATEEYLKQPALDNSPMDTPIYAHHGPYVSSANDVPPPSNSLLLSHSMHGSTVRLASVLHSMSEHDMEVLYHKCLAAHSIVPSRSRRLSTSTSHVVRHYLEPDRSLHGPVFPVANDAFVMSPSSAILSSNIVSDSNRLRPPSPINWHLAHRDSSDVSVDLNLIDPEILKTNGLTTGSFDPKNSMEPPQVGSEDGDFGTCDGIKDTFAQGPL